MNVEELRAEVGIEFEALQRLVQELASLQRDLAHRDPTVRETTAAAAFLAQFYTGIENALKRLSRFHRVSVPVGDNWHFELFQRFCPPGQPPLPVLFDEPMAEQLSAFRRFRHVAHHGYGFQFQWERMHEGVEQAPALLARFRDVIDAHLRTL